MTLEYDAVINYAKHLLSDYGINIVYYEMTVGGDYYRGHIYIDTEGDIEKVPEKVIEDIKEFAMNSGGFKDINMKGYTIKFRQSS